jgi:hypothetical protein
MTKLQELKEKARLIGENKNSMSIFNNKVIGELFTEILNNPAVFTQEEAFLFPSSYVGSATPISGTLADVQTIGTGILTLDDQVQINYTFNFENIPQFNALRMSYRATAQIDLYIEYPTSSETYSSLIYSFPSTNGAFITVDVPWVNIASSVTIGEGFGANLFQAEFPNTFEIDYIVLI